MPNREIIFAIGLQAFVFFNTVKIVLKGSFPIANTPFLPFIYIVVKHDD